MTDLQAVPRTDVPNRVYQCPGCWSVTTNPLIADGYECECGERLFVIDLRDTEPSPFRAEAASLVPAPDLDGFTEALDEAERLSQGVALGIDGVELARINRAFDTKRQLALARLRGHRAASPTAHSAPREEDRP